MSDQFPFAVSLCAEHWANTQKRMAFLEAVLTEVMRDHSHLREWFTAQELAALDLPKLPKTAEGIARKAAHHTWRKKREKREGRTLWAYHFSSLPNAAFEAFIRRIIDIPDFEGLHLPCEEQPPSKPTKEPTPEWMLPLMRIIKNNRAKTWQEAYTLITAETHINAPPQDIEIAFKKAIQT